MSEETRTDMGLVKEEMPSLADFADEPGGAWPKGWYQATVIEGYATRNGKVFQTSDEPSRTLDSRNLRMCLAVTNGKDTRQFSELLNYRVEDFTSERLEAIKELREQFRGARGSWPGYSDIQRSSLAVAKLGQVEKAFGFRLAKAHSGGLNPAPFVGQKVDVRLGINDNGYNEVNAWAKAGSRTGFSSKKGESE